MFFLRKSLMLLAVTVMVFTACNKESFEEPELLVEDQMDLGDNGKIIEGKYIVVLKQDQNNLKSGLTYAAKQKALRAEIQSLVGLKSADTELVEHLFVESIYGFSGKLSSDLYNKLASDSRVAYIEPDRVVMLAKPTKPDDVTTLSQEIPWGITRVGYGDGTGKSVWILDTGVDLDHPDLNVDQTRGYSVFTTRRDATPDDGNGHGTHVAGTIAALNNSEGVLGVAAGATVVPVKVLDSRGSGAYSGVIMGIEYVAANAKSGEVANMSLGGPVSDALDQAVLAAAAKGVVFSLAAGNESDDANNHSPARVNHANVYTISAMDLNDNWAYFSNYANPPVDYCAPGVNIKSTWKGGTYNTISGTSMAAPHAAGVLVFGAARTDGYVLNDPDGNSDPIIHR